MSLLQLVAMIFGGIVVLIAWSKRQKNAGRQEAQTEAKAETATTVVAIVKKDEELQEHGQKSEDAVINDPHVEPKTTADVRKTMNGIRERIGK